MSEKNGGREGWEGDGDEAVQDIDGVSVRDDMKARIGSRVVCLVLRNESNQMKSRSRTRQSTLTEPEKDGGTRRTNWRKILHKTVKGSVKERSAIRTGKVERCLLVNWY